jgi:hypothetical protein
MPDDWDSEAVDEVLAACRNRALARGEAGLAAVRATALAAACAGLGRSRARAGVGIAETIDDLVALFAVLSGDGGERAGVLSEGRHWDPALRLVGAIAEGWAEESVSQFARGGCEDPLSGMATLPYLRTRLAEVYREAEQRGTSPAETHRLLVVGLPRRPDPWRRLALPILVGATCGPPSPAVRRSRWPSRVPPSPWSRPAATCRCGTPGCGGTSRPRSAPRSA